MESIHLAQTTYNRCVLGYIQYFHPVEPESLVINDPQVTSSLLAKEPVISLYCLLEKPLIFDQVEPSLFLGESKDQVKFDTDFTDIGVLDTHSIPFSHTCVIHAIPLFARGCIWAIKCSTQLQRYRKVVSSCTSRFVASGSTDSEHIYRILVIHIYSLYTY